MGTGRAAAMYRKYARGFYMRNRRLAEAINDPIERAYQLEQGARLNQRFTQLQSASNTAAVAAQIEQEFNIVHAPPGTRNGQFRVVGTPGNYRFERIDSGLLESARERELAELQEPPQQFHKTTINEEETNRELVTAMSSQVRTWLIDTDGF